MKHIKNWSRGVKSCRGVIDGGGRRLGEVRPSFSVETSYINPSFGTCENKKGKAKNFPSLYLARKENKKTKFCAQYIFLYIFFKSSFLSLPFHKFQLHTWRSFLETFIFNEHWRGQESNTRPMLGKKHFNLWSF